MTGLKLLACTEAPQVIPPLKGEGRRALARRGGVPTRPLAIARVHPSPASPGRDGARCGAQEERLAPGMTAYCWGERRNVSTAKGRLYSLTTEISGASSFFMPTTW